MTFAPLGGRENFGRLGRAAAVTCLVIGTVHRIHVSLHVIRQRMSRAIHRKPFSFSRLSILAYVHSPFNDHGEPVSSLLDRTLRLKAAFVRFFCPSIICIVSRSLSHWKWPGHGSSRRPRHQQHWSRNRWAADQPFGSNCPWQPWGNGRLSNLNSSFFIFFQPEKSGAAGLGLCRQKVGSPMARRSSPCKAAVLFVPCHG